MKFENALIEYRKGKSIKRECHESWTHNIKYNTLKIYWSDILNDDWIVLEEPGKTFPEVFEAFKEGKKLMRKKWKIEGDEDYLQICTARILHVNDLLATDWEIME